MDITITVPENDFARWREEVLEAKEKQMELWFRLPSMPKRALAGDKCFVIYKNNIIGYHVIDRVVQEMQGFMCEITLRQWPAGIYVIRKGESWVELDKPIASESHRGYRYKKDN